MLRHSPQKKVLPLTLETMTLTMETFLRKVATCKFVYRFYGVSEETVYLQKDLFEEFIELMEEQNAKTVYSECSDYIILLACELGYRLAMIGHTSIHSKSEETKEFEELRKAQTLFISITYDRNVPDENLEEGDVLLSSWKGGVILFRTETPEITAARRILASAVVNHSAKAQDKERCNKLMDLVCWHIKRTEELLENTLHRADSKSQIAELESFNVNSRDKVTETFPIEKPTVGADAEHTLPLLEIPGLKDRSKRQDLDSEYTDSETSKSTNSSNMAKDISSARPRRLSLSMVYVTMYNSHTAERKIRRRHTDQSHLQKWLSMPSVIRNVEYVSNISRADSRALTEDPNSNRRSVSDGTRQRKQSLSRQRNNSGDYQSMTLQGDQMHSGGEHVLDQHIQTAFIQRHTQPTGLSDMPNENETRQARGLGSSTAYDTNAETHHDQQSGHKATRLLRDQHSTDRRSALQNNDKVEFRKPQCHT